MTDIVFAAVPYVETTEPIMAPGYLKAIVAQHGFTSVAMDLNIEFLEKIKHHPHRDELIKFNLQDSAVSVEVAGSVDELIDYCAQRILNCQPRVIGLSLLTFISQRFTKLLLLRLRQLAPTVKIVIGGSGIKDFVADKKNHFCEDLKKHQLIDHYILGDGENAIVQLLNNNLSYPGIDSEHWVQPTNLADFPYPDYSDYNFDLYADKVIPIVDSQGCVRTCEFCDIIEHWKKYTYKPAEYAFNEMLHQSRKHGIYRFSMRNSLTNGNLKEFKRWVELIADYNQTATPDTQFSWFGYFIVRNASQHPEELWEKIGQSNGSLFLGVESVIERVRWEFGKKFYNQDIDYHLAMGQKYHIPLLILLISGSPSETREDYEYTKQWLKDRLHYAKNSVSSVSITLASILPGTEWQRKINESQIAVGQYPVLWVNQQLNITQEERLNYFNQLIEICKPYNKDTPWEGMNDQTASLTILEEFYDQ